MRAHGGDRVEFDALRNRAERWLADDPDPSSQAELRAVIESLPAFVQPLAWLTPLYHGVVLARGLSLGTFGDSPTIELALVHLAILVAFVVVGAVFTVRTVSAKLLRG